MPDLITTDVVDWWKRDNLPDWDVLGNRLFVTDGVAPNTVRTGQEGDDRTMGVYPPWSDPEVAEEAGSTFASGKTYVYGIRHRVVDAYNRTIRSEMRLAELTTTGSTDIRVTGPAAKFLPGVGDTWAVYTDIYRSKEETGRILYKLTTVSASTAVSYLDQTADSGLTESDVYLVDDAESNMFVPPCRYVRTHLGRLYLGGVAEYARGTVTVSVSNLDQLTVSSAGAVRFTDRWASIYIEELGEVFQVTDVDEEAGVWTIDRDAEVGTYSYVLYRDEALYILEPLPENIEGYRLDNEIIYHAGADNPLRGIAVANGYVYLLHQRGIALVDGTSGEYGVLWLREGLGCASHATISDRDSDVVYAYTGRDVIAIDGQQVRIISSQIEHLIRDSVDHTYDPWTHAVYDPRRRMYHLWLFAAGEVAATGLRAPSLMLSYDVDAQRWYPGTLTATYSTVGELATNERVAMVMIPGRVMELDDDYAYDGAAYSGTLDYGEDGQSTNVLYDAEANWTENLVGLPITILDYDSNVIDRQVIRSHDTDSLVIYGEWANRLEAGMQYRIGYVHYYGERTDLNYRPMHQEKLVARGELFFDPDTEDQMMALTLDGRRTSDMTAATAPVVAINLNGAEQGEVQGHVRGRGCRIRWEGITNRPVVIRGLRLVMEAVDDYE